MKALRSVIAALPLLLVACAHPYVIAPDITRLNAQGIPPVPCNVGYVLTDADLGKSVTSTGGGGDQVTFFPYKDLEPALYRVLSNTFKRAYVLKSAQDATTIKANNLTFVFLPTIATSSSSTALFTWMPTDFSVDLTCKALDVDGRTVWEKTFTGKGHAEWNDLKNDYYLASRRASLEALTQLQKALLESPEFRK